MTTESRMEVRNMPRTCYSPIAAKLLELHWTFKFGRITCGHTLSQLLGRPARIFSGTLNLFLPEKKAIVCAWHSSFEFAVFLRMKMWKSSFSVSCIVILSGSCTPICRTGQIISRDYPCWPRTTCTGKIYLLAFANEKRWATWSSFTMSLELSLEFHSILWHEIAHGNCQLAWWH